MDLLLIIFVIFFIVAYSLWPSNKGFSISDYIIASRNLGVLDTAFTILATKIGGGLLITFSVYYFRSGSLALVFFGAYALGYFMFGFWGERICNFARENNILTISEFYCDRSPRKKWFVQWLTVLSMVAWIATNSIVGGQLIQQLTSLNAIAASLLLLLSTGFYVVFGGYRSVVRTDNIQILGFGVVLLVGLLATLGIQGEAHHSATLVEVASLFDPISRSEIGVWFIVGLLFPFGSFDLYQRAFSAESGKVYRHAIWIVMGVFLIVGVVLAIILHNLKTYNPLIPGAEALTRGMSEMLASSPGLLALWMVGMICVILSSLDTFIFAAAQALNTNRGLEKKMPSREALGRASIAMAGIGLVIVIVAQDYEKSVLYITHAGILLTVIIALVFLLTQWRLLWPKKETKIP